MDDLSYRERWYKKLPIYEKLGIIDTLITTTESEQKTGMEESVREIINDMQRASCVTHKNPFPLPIIMTYKRKMNKLFVAS
jgi:hypothetical protein